MNHTSHVDSKKGTSHAKRRDGVTKATVAELYQLVPRDIEQLIYIYNVIYVSYYIIIYINLYIH